jgi:mannose-6-phosphate isomerase-like protein (cupin superfamily)
MQLLRFPPNTDGYPEHDHSDGGQEEVYIVIEGRAHLRAGDEEHDLEPGVFARVGPNERRTITTGDEGAVILALGGIPGKPYEIVGFTEEGAPAPNAPPPV